jgi:O-methyltransferase
VRVDAPSESRLAAARAGLAAAREVRAAGPGPGESSSRAAYLELLKLCLCDLAGAGTVSVGRTEDGKVFSRELAGDQLGVRAAGMDWPAHGLTMVGLRRLDDLQKCVEAVVGDGIEGDLIEAGAWRGGSSILMRATLDSLGEEDRTVWVADSFAGFPLGEAGADEDDLSVFDFLAVSLEQARGNFARLGLDHGVKFIEGFFDQTLPGLADRRWSLVRLDADTYETTQLALRCLYPGLAVGGYLVVDDFGALEECAAAVEDFRREQHISEPLEEIDWTGVRWRRQTAGPLAGPAVPSADGSSANRRATRAGTAKVPTLDELQIKEELEQLRRRLAQAESELDALRRSRLVRLHAAVRARISGAKR